MAQPVDPDVEIPLYLTGLGGSASVAGLALLAFAAPSFIVRPWLGEVADRIGLVGVRDMDLGPLLVTVLGLRFVAAIRKTLPKPIRL